MASTTLDRSDGAGPIPNSSDGAGPIPNSDRSDGAGPIPNRPSLRTRARLASIAIVAASLALLLLFSDRAPIVLADWFGDRSDAVRARAALGGWTRVLHDLGLLENDVVVHVVIWAVVTMFVSLAIWSWRGLAYAVAALYGVSLTLELAQERLTTTRTVEVVDIAANGAGVVVGGTVSALLFVAWRSLRSRSSGTAAA